MKPKTTTPGEDNFTMVSDKLAASIQLNLSEKIIISRILRFTDNGEICFISNSVLAKMYGIGVSTVKDAIRSCIEHGFLERDVEHNEETNEWSSYREMRINKVKLDAFLEAEKAALPVKKLKRKRTDTVRPTVTEKAVVAPVLTPHTEPVTPAPAVRKVLTNEEWEERQMAKQRERFNEHELFGMKTVTLNDLDF